MRKRILVVSLGRSGHHAVTNWMCYHFPGRVEVKNNCTVGWENGFLQPVKNRRTTYTNASKGKTEVCTLEAFDMEDFVKFGIGDFKIDMVVLVVRSVYNWVASRYAGVEESRRVSEIISPFVDDRGNRKWSNLILWKRQASQAIYENGDGGYDWLSFSPVLTVLYDRWVEDESYRRALIEGMGLKFTDEGRDEVPLHGSGSTFDGFDYRDRGSEMDVLNRWRLFEEDRRFRNLFDVEAHVLNQALFKTLSPPWES